MGHVIGVDVGGTLTDAVLISANGAMLFSKSPSPPPDYGEGAIDRSVTFSQALCTTCSPQCAPPSRPKKKRRPSADSRWRADRGRFNFYDRKFILTSMCHFEIPWRCWREDMRVRRRHPARAVAERAMPLSGESICAKERMS